MNLTSIKFLLLSYISIALIGAVLLSLPFSHTTNITFVDAFFTSVSALACTGLIIKDTALDFTPMGHGILLFLIQLGGFGYMTMLGLIYVLLRKQLSNAEKNMLKEALNHSQRDDLINFIKQILVFVLVIESIGAVLLSLDFSMRFGVADGIWYGVFHAISAFNNGGFSIFPDSLMDFRSDIVVNFVICALSILGGVGYVFLAELHLFIQKKLRTQESKKQHMFSLHFKIVFYVSLLLTLLGALMVLSLEWDNPQTFGTFDAFEKVLASLFTSINFRSAGFVTYDVSNLYNSTLFFSVFFMLIGGAPGGTAGGIKVTTLAVIFAFSRSILNYSEPRLFKRAIMRESVQKALMIFLISSFYFLILALLLTLFEPGIDFAPLMFEISSAFSNAGLSMGDGGILSLSANFNEMGKFLIIIAMALGKIGVIVFTLALFGRGSISRVRYVPEKIIL